MTNIKLLKHFLHFVLLLIITDLNAQSVEILTSGTKTSIRGLSVVTDKVIWVSGSAGTVGRSVDKGKTWKWMTVKGFEKTEFRDIEAFDENSAVIMGITQPAVILKTINRGIDWEICFYDTAKEVFLDAMEFWNEQSGIVIGDPVKGKFFTARTFDGGKTWTSIPEDKKPVALEGEACFASSGTNIRKLYNKEAVFVSGGIHSHFFYRNEKIKLPLMQGKESTGANSLAVKNAKTLMAVGGDFNDRNRSDSNCVLSMDGGKSWSIPATLPAGYRSCIEYIGEKSWVTCGLTGVDISIDEGNNFRLISKESFHVCRKAKKGKAVFFAGGNGKIGKLVK